MILILEIAAGVILGALGLHALQWIKNWVYLAPWRQRVVRIAGKQPITDLQFLGILALVVILLAVTLAYLFGAFR